MNTNQGIFENYPNHPSNRQNSPFSVAPDPTTAPVASSPFAAVARQDSPFTVVDAAADSGRSTHLPERRKMDSPFQVAEPSEGFGFEAPSAFIPQPTPFEAAPTVSPFSAPAQSPPPNAPSAAESGPLTSPATQAAIAAFSAWDEPAHRTQPVQSFVTPPAFAPAPTAVPPAFQASPTPAFSAPQAQAEPTPQATAWAPTATAASEAPQVTDDSHSDSHSIRQLELRAIFGVDREMNPDEILQRSRALPGMRNVARVNPHDMGTIEAIKNLIPSLGFGTGNLKIYSGAVPLEFIREGAVMLAVQTDGGFAPGVRETLMIVARELNRLG